MGCEPDNIHGYMPLADVSNTEWRGNMLGVELT